MILKYSDEFNKSVKKLNDKIALKRLFVLIEKLEDAESLNEIQNVSAISNYHGRYRIRTGDFRLIVKYIRGEITILLLDYLKRDEKTYRKYN